MMLPRRWGSLIDRQLMKSLEARPVGLEFFEKHLLIEIKESISKGCVGCRLAGGCCADW
jgi:hypothetical protein